MATSINWCHACHQGDGELGVSSPMGVLEKGDIGGERARGEKNSC